MSFRKPCHMPFRKLIPPFTLTGYRSDKRVHFLNNQFMNGISTWFDCSSSFRNLRISLSDLHFDSTFQFVKYDAPA